MVDKAKEIVKKLTFSYESDSFENPGKRHNLSMNNVCTTYMYVIPKCLVLLSNLVDRCL